jgi:hypothetical protein
MKSIIIIKSISILLLVLTSCKSSTEKKIIGSWKGTCTNKAFSDVKPRYCEMEFNDEGEFYTRHSDLEKIELNTPIIEEYKIIGDSLITYLNKNRDSYFIEFISEKKIVLKEKLGSMNDFYYELNKQ